MLSIIGLTVAFICLVNTNIYNIYQSQIIKDNYLIMDGIMFSFAITSIYNYINSKYYFYFYENNKFFLEKMKFVLKLLKKL
jgi:hypothetical protein